MTEKTGEKAVLLLADGTSFEGTAIGKRGTAFGRVAFTTSMVGYQEALTTPANAGLLLIQTFPLAGNYGVNPQGKQSEETAAGYIVRELCEKPSNYQCAGDLESFLRESGIVGISGLDTRRLTRYIRENGEMNGVICPVEEKDGLAEALAQYRYEPKLREQAAAIGVIGGGTSGGGKQYRLLLVDFGISYGLLGDLARHGLVPAGICRGSSLSDEIKEIDFSAYDGILLSDGPGDPASYAGQLEGVCGLVKSGLPIFGISLGHQLLALSQGMKTAALRHGHRGDNQPVSRPDGGRTYITSQSHGFVVERDSVLADVATVSYENANDKTVEGLCYRSIPAMSVQFLPGGKTGSQSTGYLYDEFAALMDKRQKGE